MRGQGDEGGAGEPGLIVTADDFGASAAVNQAVITAWEQGILTSASLMVTGAAADEAVALARARPGLAVGLHLVLTEGRPCLPPEMVPALVGADGCFPRRLVWTGVRWFLSPAARAQIQREIRAQVGRFQQTGLRLDHLDSHHHFHLHPVVFEALLTAAEEAGVRALRLPVEPWFVLGLERAGQGRAALLLLLFHLFGTLYRRRLRARGFLILDGVFGLLQTGRLTETSLLALLEALPPGCFELYTHPRLDTPAGRAELAALTSPRVREAVARRGVRLTTYGALLAGAPPGRWGHQPERSGGW